MIVRDCPRLSEIDGDRLRCTKMHQDSPKIDRDKPRKLFDIVKEDRVVNSSGSDMVNFYCTEYRGPTQQKTGIILISFNSECGSAQPFIMCFVFLQQQICCLRRAHPPP